MKHEIQSICDSPLCDHFRLEDLSLLSQLRVAVRFATPGASIEANGCTIMDTVAMPESTSPFEILKVKMSVPAKPSAGVYVTTCRENRRSVSGLQHRRNSGKQVRSDVLRGGVSWLLSAVHEPASSRLCGRKQKSTDETICEPTAGCEQKPRTDMLNLPPRVASR